MPTVQGNFVKEEYSLIRVTLDAYIIGSLPTYVAMQKNFVLI